MSAQKPNGTSAATDAGVTSRVRRERPAAAYRPFSVDALPDPMRQYVVESARSLGCDPSYVALPALSAVAGLIGNKFVAKPKPDWTVPCVLWTAIVGESGTAKSPAVRAALQPLYERQSVYLRRHQEKLKEHQERERKAKRGRVRPSGSGDALDRAADDVTAEDPGPPPACQRIIVGDTTVEALAAVLSDNPCGVLLARDELSGWFMSLNQYKGGSGSDKASYLQMFDAGRIEIDRKTGDRRHTSVGGAAVSMTGGVQPAVLGKCFGTEEYEDGLASRFLLAYPPRSIPGWIDFAVSPEASANYSDCLTDIGNIDPEIGDSGAVVPKTLRLDEYASAALRQFVDDLAVEMRESDGAITAALAKLKGYAVRLAMVHHIASRAGTIAVSAHIGAESMDAGIKLARWFGNEARRVYAVLGESESDTAIRKLVEFIERRGGSITVRQLLTSNVRKYRDSQGAREALTELVLGGYGSWVPRGSKPTGGRPEERFKLHDVGGGDSGLPPDGGCRPDGTGDTGTSNNAPYRSGGHANHAEPYADDAADCIDQVRCASGDAQVLHEKHDLLTQDGELESHDSLVSHETHDLLTHARAGDYHHVAPRDETFVPEFDESAYDNSAANHAFHAIHAAYSGNGTETEDTGSAANHALHAEPASVGESLFEPSNSCNTVDPVPVGHVGEEPSVATVPAAGTDVTETDMPRVESIPPSIRLLVEAVGYTVVTDSADLMMVATAVEQTALVGLDTETTGLNPRADRLRLLSLATDTVDGGTHVYLIDCAAVDPRPLWSVLAGVEVVGHNLAFDLAFLAKLGFEPGRVSDTMLTSQVLHAGTSVKHTLEACAKRELGIKLYKEHQKADWSGMLSREMLEYAALDASVARPLHRSLLHKAEEAGLAETVRIEHRALPAVVWMANAGVPIDRDAWTQLAEDAERRRADLHEKLDAASPLPPGSLFAGGRNWDSSIQVKSVLAAVGCPVESTADDALAALDHAVPKLLREYRAAAKLATTYGKPWLKNVAADGRVYAKWWQAATATGRMSCSGPNLQQLPRGGHRRCVAAPPGRVLVKADYSQIELRIAARVAGETRMMGAFLRREDLHALTARQVLGKDDVTKADRQLAKAVNFGLLYGMGANGFRDYARSQYGVELTERQAHDYREKFFCAYPKLREWHQDVGRANASEARSMAGRRRLFDATTKFTERLNTPVQSTGADAIKSALALLWERRDECPTAVPILAAHDEIVAEVDESEADLAASWVMRAMGDAFSDWLGPAIPIEVESKCGRTWDGD
ncbi:MAG: DNA polymerase [Gemmataceae bacterium]